MKSILSTTFVVVIFLASGCTKTIPITLDTYSPKLSIESILEPGTTPKVYLNTTVPFFLVNQLPTDLFVHDAEVIISTTSSADILQPDSIYNKFFCRWEPFYSGNDVILENEDYTLTVRVNGETFTASTRTNVQAVSIDSVDYTSSFTDLYGGHEGVIVDFMDIPGQANQYRFEMDRPLNNEHTTVDDFEISSTCLADGETYTIEEIGRFVYFDTNFDGAPIRFVVEPAYTNRKGDPGTIYIQSLSREAADFYDALDRQRESNINPFIEPVFVETEIEGAIGVFGAMKRSDPVQFVFPEDSL